MKVKACNCVELTKDKSVYLQNKFCGFAFVFSNKILEFLQLCCNIILEHISKNTPMSSNKSAQSPGFMSMVEKNPKQYKYIGKNLIQKIKHAFLSVSVNIVSVEYHGIEIRERVQPCAASWSMLVDTPDIRDKI